MQEEASYLLLETSAAHRDEFGTENMPLSVDIAVFWTPTAHHQGLAKP
jgi:hypothetical protein